MYQPCALKQINPIQITKNNICGQRERPLQRERTDTEQGITEDAK